MDELRCVATMGVEDGRGNVALDDCELVSDSPEQRPLSSLSKRSLSGCHTCYSTRRVSVTSEASDSDQSGGRTPPEEHTHTQPLPLTSTSIMSHPPQHRSHQHSLT